jgi:hypothetical protein
MQLDHVRIDVIAPHLLHVPTTYMVVILRDDPEHSNDAMLSIASQDPASGQNNDHRRLCRVVETSPEELTRWILILVGCRDG